MLDKVRTKKTSNLKQVNRQKIIHSKTFSANLHPEKNSEAEKKCCAHCIMSMDNDPDLILDSFGICNHCHNYRAAQKKLPQTQDQAAIELDKQILEIKQKGKGKKYDAILGVSGGIDSTYLAGLCKTNGLNVLLFHCDNGWNSEVSVKNIQNLSGITGYNLHTYVMDWESFKDLQLAFIKAGVVDIELPYEYALYVSMLKVARKLGIKAVLSGSNLTTEGTYMPKSWVHNKLDLKNILDIHNKFGTKKLIAYPRLSVLKHLYYEKMQNPKVYKLLNYTDYRVDEVKKHIGRHLGWSDYGGKHCESVFTRFYQEYILPQKFKINKRQYHLSTLIQSKQISRDEALVKIKVPHYTDEKLKVDHEFVLKKFGLSSQKFNAIMAAPITKHTDFKNIYTFWHRYFKCIRLVKKITFFDKLKMALNQNSTNPKPNIL